MTSPLPPSESLHFDPPRARRRWHRTWPGIAAIAVAVAIVGGGLAYVLWPGSPSPYALGKDFETAPAQADAGLVTGPVSQLAKACTGSCATKAYATGKSIALSASALPGLNPKGATDSLGAVGWCTDLTGNRFGLPLSPSVESQLRAGEPALGPATGYWDQGCEAAYRAAPVPRFEGNGLTVSGAFGAAPGLAIPAQPAGIKGKGAVVQSGQQVAVQYTGVIWRTGQVFGSSWSSGTPLTFSTGGGQVIKGLDAGLLGQTAGSRVLLVIPPADGYGSAGSAAAGIEGTDTLAFVVDILAAA